MSTSATVVVTGPEGTNFFDPRLIIGPMQVGALVTAALFGSLVIQSYIYFTKFADSLGFKATVKIIQIGHFCAMISTLWTMTVTAYDDPTKLNVLPVGADITVLLTSITSFLTQASSGAKRASGSFYIYRLWRLSGNCLLPVVSEILCIAGQVAAFILVTKAITMSSFSRFVVEQTDVVLIALATRTICDITITAGVTWSLIQKRRNSIVKSTTIIDYLIMWTIENGLTTSLMTLSVMAVFLCLRETFVWFGLYLIQANVVANALLASLNRRLVLRKDRPLSDGDTAMVRSSLLCIACGIVHITPQRPIVIRVDVTHARDTESQIKTHDSFY
ncbi:hypothetical protein DEU56DRAFT_892122 [Suillus clintonianus]|uniref:uncharacterized protein n=1 Tax=Suillus clintonianus TaxID=1904413 RepID=UPI001B87FAE5|nr:uncharacterized protein DEU56DRAFT_892122 [Suillus clintonianus]KAG2126058.1 hypothetical protein DEU56DRAFT_892122 [Suillus clintonianus]